MMKMIKNKILFLITIFITLTLFSQEQEQYKGLIKNDAKKGFKAVELTPNIRAVANTNLSDLRILNTENQQIPYYLQEHSYEVFEKFILLKNKISFGAKSTHILIKNSDKKLFDHFTFKVSNADVRKTCKIEGSDANKKWFVISDKIYLTLNNNTEKAFNYYDINFPSIDYKYIKLVINDSLSAPINIKSVGYFDRNVVLQKTTFNTLAYKYVISQKERSTLIHVQADRSFEINKIDFTIDAPELYKRQVSLYTLRKVNGKEVKRSLAQFSLNSDTKNILEGINFKQRDFWIEIDNKDNQPLTINKLQFYQKKNFVVADLKPNQTYAIVAGDKKLKKPSYDLVNFKHKIDTNLSLMNIENEQIYFKENNIKEIKKAFYEQAWFMWFAIGLVALIILYFTLSLAKETEV